ncbi:MAG: SIMPL domain-containing protein [Chloroflexota bacterium]|nr:SIMPL domain-containing protein [Chloroflexota bacterium]
MAVSRPFHRITGILVLIALLVVSLPAVAMAQTPEEAPVEEPRRSITVEGTGTVDLAPDTAEVTFGVLTQNESLESAQDENSRRLQAVIDALTAAGIAEEDIATSEYMVYPINEYDRDGNLVGIQGYEVFSSVTATIRDLSIVGQVLDNAVGAGANEISSISFYVENTDEPAAEARRMAVENAREKADELAEAAGVIVVGVYEIQETSAPAPESDRYEVASDMLTEEAESAPMEVPVSPGQTEITVQVRVVFEIDQPLG